MITEEHVVTLFDQANPIPDAELLDLEEIGAARHLATLERRSSEVTQLDTKESDNKDKTRNVTAILVTAAAAIVIAIGLVVMTSNDGSPDVANPGIQETTTTEATTTSTAPSITEAEALAIVESLFAAVNNGDGALFSAYREGMPIEPRSGESYEVAAESRLTVEGQCTSRGFRAWRIEGPLAPPMTGYGFDCKVTATDLLLAAAGIELEMTYNWVIGPDGTPESSMGGSNERGEVVDEFFGEFRSWIAANHPDVEASIGFEDGGITAEGVPIALEYIDEFVAQSDIYPLTEPVPESDDFGGPLR